ncbi:hypothetical protein HYT53_03205 [Candidatus Woesearchaeota archaeon]|nr:hypothetical protein [Candidatus Woesearchaeota archaeon]
MPDFQFQKRLVARKVRISDILQADFARDDSSAGFIKVGGLNVSRVSMLGAVVHKSGGAYAGAVIDDGTGKIALRAFENIGVFSKADVGDFVLVIGKIRSFSDEKYVMPEIIRKIDAAWMNVRKLELKDMHVAGENAKAVAHDAEEAPANDEVYSLIKSLDNGDGVSVDDVIKSSKDKSAEFIINKLLESGDIFEIKPGRLKVLE